MADCTGKCDAKTRKTVVTWNPKTYTDTETGKTPRQRTIGPTGPSGQLDTKVQTEVDAYIRNNSQPVGTPPPHCTPADTCVCYLAPPKVYGRSGTVPISGQYSFGGGTSHTPAMTGTWAATLNVRIDIALEEGVCEEKLPGFTAEPWHPHAFD